MSQPCGTQFTERRHNVDCTKDATRLLGFSSTGRYPFFSLVPSFVEREQARLTAALDQLIGLRDELG